MRLTRRGLAAEGGQAIVIVALAMSALLLGMGLAIDTGVLFVARRDQQSATDAAAWAGAVILFRGDTATNAIGAATNDAWLNGYEDGVDSTTITVAAPPTSGEYSGNSLFLQVTITRTVDTFFLRGAASGLTTVTTSAVAGALPAGTGWAILTLGDTTSAFHVAGSSTLNVYDGDIHVNASDTTQAAYIEGGSVNLDIEAGYELTVVGEIRDDGLSNVTGAVVSYPTVTPQQIDPFQLLPEPTSATERGATTISGGTVTLQPGTYTGGINISSTANVTLMPGNYILRGGGLAIAGSATVSMGTDGSGNSGVLIFNTVSDHPDPTGTCGAVSISGSGQVVFTPQTSGTYKGLVLWVDEDCTWVDEDCSSGTPAIKWTGNSTHAGSGTFYVPDGRVCITGSSGTGFGLKSQIVASTLKVSGSGTVNITYDPSVNVTPYVPALVN